MAPRRQLDQELVRRGLVASIDLVPEMVISHRVTVDGAFASAATQSVDPAQALCVLDAPPRFVSRGGEKLQGALETFRIDPEDRVCLDGGSSTGGFVDCLLQNGAQKVHCVDTGSGQIDDSLRRDARVVLHESTDIRSTELLKLDDPIEILTLDLSFISTNHLIPTVANILAPQGDLVFLVKPQFEAERDEVSKGKGIIRDHHIWERVLAGSLHGVNNAGLSLSGVIPSPIRGRRGNVEFLVAASKPNVTATGTSDEDIADMVRKATDAVDK